VATKDKIIEDIARVANELGVTSLSRSRYLQFARYSGNQIYDEGRTWSELCSAAKLSTGANNEPVSDEEYFKRLTEAVEKLGRIPKASERKLYGLNVSKARYRNYSEFIREAIRKGKIVDLNGAYSVEESAPKHPEVALVPIHAGSKDQPRIIPPIPRSSKRTRWERTDIDGFPYAPQDESGVVALFAILCSQGVLRWQIIDLNSSKGIDCICYDEEAGKEIHVELKYLLTRSGWNHPLDDVDYVVCWESRWPDFPKPVFELKKFTEET
jgi:hypothetical protein